MITFIHDAYEYKQNKISLFTQLYLHLVFKSVNDLTCNQIYNCILTNLIQFALHICQQRRFAWITSLINMVKRLLQYIIVISWKCHVI